jgi:prepilin-type N-terminal cleavage/methylation domain-containing protein
MPLKTAGFSLIEVLVATAVITVGVASLAQLVVVSTRANRIAATTTATLLLAEQKMEELVGEIDLMPSPSGALSANTPGFVDYLNPSGVPLGVTSVVPPQGAGFICRWSIDALPNSAANTLVLQVVVFSWPQNAGQTRLASVKFRKGS